MDGQAGRLVQHQEALVEVQLGDVLRHLGLGVGTPAQGEGEPGRTRVLGFSGRSETRLRSRIRRTRVRDSRRIFSQR
jgi:hypothetical protein